MRRLLLTAAALAVSLALTAALAADDPPPLKFGWPVPSKVRVTETIQKLGQTATTRFTANLTPAAEGSADLLLHLGDFEVLELYGKPGTDKAVAAHVELTLIQLRLTPDLLLAPTGEVKEVLGLDTAVNTMLDELAKNADPDKKAMLPQLRAQFTAPGAQAAMKENAQKTWTVWTGEWLGRVVPEGRGADATFTIACPDGSRTNAPTRLRRMPGTDEGEGLVKFTRESVLDGEDSRPILDAWLKQIKAQTGKDVPATALRLINRSLTVADPATLKPRRVVREEHRILSFDKAPDKVDIERHEYVFEWR